MSKNSVIEVIEYTDPYCTWCWGSEPILRKIQEVYGSQVEIRFKMGGLVENIRKFYDPLNEIGGANWYKQVADHWLDASKRHGMPVDEKVWYDIKDEFRSTHPANIAYKSAEFQDEILAKKFLRRMREAAAAERMAIHRIEVQERLAQEVGLDPVKFRERIENGDAEKAFREELQESQLRGITGFPTFLVRYSNKEVLLHGYHKFETFEYVFMELAGDALKSYSLKCDESSILSFVQKYGKVATKEVAEVFDLSLSSAMKILNLLKDKNLVKEQKAGNGFFHLPRSPFEYDIETGICRSR